MRKCCYVGISGKECKCCQGNGSDFHCSLEITKYAYCSDGKIVSLSIYPQIKANVNSSQQVDFEFQTRAICLDPNGKYVLLQISWFTGLQFDNTKPCNACL